MNDDPVLTELEETRRELWEESDGTLSGYARMVDRLGRGYREEFLAEQARKGLAVLDYSDAVCVCEGEAPNYQTTKLADGETDLSRKGAEGDAAE